MSSQEHPARSWVPDAKTITWAFGRAHEDDVKDAIRSDVRHRGHGLEPESDEYWALVAEAAVEAVLYDLSNKAREDGAVFTDDARGIPET